MAGVYASERATLRALSRRFLRAGRHVSLVEALELTLLIAPEGRPAPASAGRRWLLRYLEEDGEATIDELAFAASCLAALTGNGYPEAAQALPDMAERRLGDTAAEA